MLSSKLQLHLKVQLPLHLQIMLVLRNLITHLLINLISFQILVMLQCLSFTFLCRTNMFNYAGRINRILRPTPNNSIRPNASATRRSAAQCTTPITEVPHTVKDQPNVPPKRPPPPSNERLSRVSQQPRTPCHPPPRPPPFTKCESSQGKLLLILKELSDGSAHIQMLHATDIN